MENEGPRGQDGTPQVPAARMENHRSQEPGWKTTGPMGRNGWTTNVTGQERLDNHGSRNHAPKGRFQEPGSKTKVPGARVENKGSRRQAGKRGFEEPGSKTRVPGARLENEGSRCQGRKQGPQDPKTRIQATPKPSGFGNLGEVFWGLFLFCSSEGCTHAYIHLRSSPFCCNRHTYVFTIKVDSNLYTNIYTVHTYIHKYS